MSDRVGEPADGVQPHPQGVGARVGAAEVHDDLGREPREGVDEGGHQVGGGRRLGAGPLHPQGLAHEREGHQQRDDQAAPRGSPGVQGQGQHHAGEQEHLDRRDAHGTGGGAREGGRGDGGRAGRQADTLQALPGDPVPQPAPAAPLEHGPQPAGHGDQPGAQQQAARQQPGDPGLGGHDEAQQHDPEEEPLDRPHPGGVEALLAVRPGPPHPRVDDQGGSHADEDGWQRAGHGTDQQRDVRRREGRQPAPARRRAALRVRHRVGTAVAAPETAQHSSGHHGRRGRTVTGAVIRTNGHAGAPAVPERSAVYRRGRPLRAGARRLPRAVSRPGRGPGRRGPRCRAAPRRRWRS